MPHRQLHHVLGVAGGDLRKAVVEEVAELEVAFPLGGGQVIQGWDQGIPGMRVGGRRQLTIPPDLGYGAQGQPPDILPNETLIFVVDLLKVQKG